MADFTISENADLTEISILYEVISFKLLIRLLFEKTKNKVVEIID